MQTCNLILFKIKVKSKRKNKGLKKEVKLIFLTAEKYLKLFFSSKKWTDTLTKAGNLTNHQLLR